MSDTQGLLDEEDHRSGSRRRKPTVNQSPRRPRSLCNVCAYVSLVILCVGTVVATWFGYKIVKKAWFDLHNPFANTFHHNAIDGSRESLIVDRLDNVVVVGNPNTSTTALQPHELVTPLFGPENVALVNKFDLGVAIWALVPDQHDSSAPTSAQENVEIDSDDDSQRRQALDDLMLTTVEKQQKKAYQEERSKLKWQLAFTDVVMNNIDLTTTKLVKATTKVTIEKDLMRQALFQGAFHPMLIAQFTMLPSSSNAIDQKQIEFINVTTTRQSRRYGIKAKWPPLPPRFEDFNGYDILSNTFLYSGIMQALTHVVRPKNVTFLADELDDFDKDKGGPTQPYLLTRSRVSMVPDSPTYRLGLYRKLRTQREHTKIKECPDWTTKDFCQRRFDFDGHFETLVECKNLTETPLASSQLEDELTFCRPLDITYDWHITFATDQAAKYDVATNLASGTVDQNVPYNMTTGQMEGTQMTVNFLRSAFGLHPEPDSKHLHKTLLGLAGLIGFGLTFFTSIHYWYTRRLTTGISLGPALVDHTFCAVVSLITFVQSTYKDGSFFSVSFLLFHATSQVFLAVPVWLLSLRMEWQFGDSFVPKLLGRRYWTHKERASMKLDQSFDWKYKVLVGVVFAAWIHLSPKLPPLMSSNDNFVGERPEEVLSTWHLASVLDRLASTVSFVNMISQALTLPIVNQTDEEEEE
ncbi:hypothetical protein OIO90_002554 [Microbotryomycetes sp. JL221]|nr:hypothetical protein OIO90_002554 [Microbotryomycetes sp. JL221]